MSTFLLLDGQQAGPFTAGQLREMWKVGKVTSETLYWRDGAADWLPLSSILHELEDVSAPPPVPPTLPPASQPKPPKKKSGCLGTTVKLVLLFFAVCVVIALFLPKPPSGSSSGKAANEGVGVSAKPVVAAAPAKQKVPDAVSPPFKFVPDPSLKEDITTVSGVTYTGANITSVEPDGLRITHDSGLGKIPFTDLSEEIRTKYGYDPQKVAQFQAQQREAEEARKAAVAKAQSDKEEAEDKKLTAEIGEKPLSSAWDGSVIPVERYLKDNLKDPKSLEFIEWSDVYLLTMPTGKAWAVRVKYRAKNSFGGYAIENQVAVIRHSKVVEMVPYQ